MKSLANCSVLVIAIVLCASSLKAQTSPMLGNWRENGGSVIRIEPCSTGVCLRLLSLSPKLPGTKDVHNPNAAQRGRPLCNLEIGSQFRLSDAEHASGGWLYDPKTGNTYHGTITVEGDTLKLRGYLGVPIFGRTEIWQRVSGGIAPCNDVGKR